MMIIPDMRRRLRGLKEIRSAQNVVTERKEEEVRRVAAGTTPNAVRPHGRPSLRQKQTANDRTVDTMNLATAKMSTGSGTPHHR